MTRDTHAFMDWWPIIGMVPWWFIWCPWNMNVEKHVKCSKLRRISTIISTPESFLWILEVYINCFQILPEFSFLSHLEHVLLDTNLMFPWLVYYIVHCTLLLRRIKMACASSPLGWFCGGGEPSSVPIVVVSLTGGEHVAMETEIN